MSLIGATIIALFMLGILTFTAYLMNLNERRKRRYYDVNEAIRYPELKLKTGGNEKYYYERRRRR